MFKRLLAQHHDAEPTPEAPHGSAASALDSLPNVTLAQGYWDDIRRDRAMPSRADFDPAQVTPLLPWVLLVAVERQPPDFRFRLVGTEIDRITARRCTGQRFSQLPHMQDGNKVWDQYAQVAKRGLPVRSEIGYVGPDQRIQRVMHGLFPLSDDGHTVNLIWTVVDLRRRS